MSKVFTGIDNIRRENVKKLMKEAGLTRGEFTEKADINYTLLGHYIGKNPTKAIGNEMAKKIESFFDKSVNWLDHEHDSLIALANNDNENNVVSIYRQNDGFIDTPVYCDYLFCSDSNDGKAFEFKRVVATRNLPLSLFTDKNINPDNFKLVCAVDSSMQPYINDGDEVGIDISIVNVRDGCIYAVLLDGDKMFKQIFKEAGEALRLHSFSASYPDRIVSADNRDSLMIVGKQVYRAG